MISEGRNSLKMFFARQRTRVQHTLEMSEARVQRARQACVRETARERKVDCEVVCRGHAHGHDAGVEWREQNV